MANGYSILTRRIQGIDVHVWLLFLFVIFVSGGVLFIKSSSANVNKVIDVLVVDDGGSARSSFYPNENLTFITKAKGRVVWDFGDGVPVKGNRVMHSFTDDGRKVITVIVNGKMKTDTVFINKNIVIAPDPTDIDPIFGPSAVNAGKKAFFIYNGKSKVQSFEWTIENDPSYPPQTTNKAYYNFASAGSVVILLELNHDPAKVFHKSVIVAAAHEKLPKPSTPHQQYHAPVLPAQNNGASIDTTSKSSRAPVPVVQHTPEIEHAAKICSDCDPIFKTMFEDVARGRYDQDFDAYLCKGVNVTVIANDQTTTMKSFCDLLRTGKYKIKTVTVFKDFQQCIKTINVQYKKKLFGL